MPKTWQSIQIVDLIHLSILMKNAIRSTTSFFTFFLLLMTSNHECVSLLRFLELLSNLFKEKITQDMYVDQYLKLLGEVPCAPFLMGNLLLKLISQVNFSSCFLFFSFSYEIYYASLKMPQKIEEWPCFHIFTMCPSVNHQIVETLGRSITSWQTWSLEKGTFFAFLM